MAAIPIILRRNAVPCAISLLAVALLVPRTQVPPPTWWQGGWPRKNVGDAAQIELLSQLAAVLMPKTPIGELFRSFPSPDGWNEDFLAPNLVAYGVLKDPHAALFVLYGESSEKRDESNRQLETKKLLAYGPPGSQVLVVGQPESSSSSKENCFYMKLSTWVAGDRVMLSKVLRNLLGQVCDSLGLVLCPDVLERMQFIRQTSRIVESTEAEEFVKTATSLTSLASSEELQSYLAAEGFNHDSIGRMQKSAYLIGLAAELEVQSGIHMLLHQGQSHGQIVETMIMSSPCLGSIDRSIQQNIQGTLQWLSQLGLEGQALTAIIAFPSIASHRAQQTLQAVAMWFLDLGVSQGQVASTIAKSPSTLACSIDNDLKPIAQWLGGLGLDPAQVARAIARCPQILGRSLKENLIPIVQWLADLGLNRHQVAKAFDRCPALLCSSLDKDLRPRLRIMRGFGFSDVQVGQTIIRFPGGFLGPSIENKLQPLCKWLGGLGLTQAAIAKAIAAFPQLLSCSIDKNLEPVVQWLRDLGLNRGQIARTIGRFPPTLCCSIVKQLNPKVKWLQEMGFSQGQLTQTIIRSPEILGYGTDNNMKRTMGWLGDLGLSKSQVVKVIVRFPSTLGCSIENKLQPTVEWLRSWELSEVQVAKTIVRCPEILSLSLAKNLEPTSHWLFSLGLTRVEVAKVIATCPKVFSCSVEKNLKLKVQWLLGLGLSQPEVAKVIVSFPAVFSYSINKNLRHKVAVLQEVFGELAAVAAISRRPIILGYSQQRLTTRLRVLSEQNETMKLITAVEMTEDRFRKRFLRTTSGSRKMKREYPDENKAKRSIQLL